MNVKEVYCGLSGECKTKGVPTVFVRLVGCNLRCRWCDSRYAYGGKKFKASPTRLFRIVEKVSSSFTHPKHILLTGGEPLLQMREVIQFIELLDPLLTVEIETNGSVPIKMLLASITHPNVIITMDYKLASSRMEAKMIMENFAALRPEDQLKFCVATKKDLRQMRDVISQIPTCRASMWCSPVSKDRAFLQEVEQFIFEHKLFVSMSIQQHKIIWGRKRQA